MPRRLRGARDVVEQRVEPFHLSHEGRDVEVLSTTRPRSQRDAHARPGARSRRRSSRPMPTHSASERSRRVAAVRPEVDQSVRVGRDDRSCPWPALRTRSTACLPRATGTRSSRTPRQRRRHVLARSRRTRSDRPGRGAGPAASSAGRSGPSPDEEEARFGMRVHYQPRGVDQIRVALRVVQPRDRSRPRTHRRECRARARAAAISSGVRGRLNSSSGTPR